MPFKISTKSEEFVVFCGAYWVKTFFSDVTFSSKSDFSIKIELKNWVSGKYFFSRVCLFEKFFIRNLPERRILNSKSDFLKFFFSIFHCAGKRLLQNLISFFRKISFQTLIFNEKVCYKVMPFKMSTQREKLVVVRGANRVKTLFLRRDFFLSKSDSSIKSELKI